MTGWSLLPAVLPFSPLVSAFILSQPTNKAAEKAAASIRLIILRFFMLFSFLSSDILYLLPCQLLACLYQFDIMIQNNYITRCKSSQGKYTYNTAFIKKKALQYAHKFIYANMCNTLLKKNPHRAIVYRDFQFYAYHFSSSSISSEVMLMIFPEFSPPLSTISASPDFACCNSRIFSSMVFRVMSLYICTFFFCPIR